MASIAQRLSGAVAASETTFYNPFTSGSATRGQFVYINFCNTTTADITLDMYFVESDTTTKRYIVDDLNIPAKGAADWHGVITIDDAAQAIKGIASATGVDFVGSVVEDA